MIDDKGVPVPTATNAITFEVTGPGAIAATDNADNTSHESFQAPTRSAYNGWCLAALRATGPGRITVKIASPGLPAQTVILEGRAK